MDEKLDSVANGIKSINDTLDPLLRNSTTPTVSSTATKESNERAALLRKHATLLGDWEAVKKESQVLREELKEDKWLTVFRTVTDQADGMMSSLEKAVNRCQDFIFQFYRKGPEHALSMSQTSLASSRSDKPAITFEVFNSLQDSYEAKKKSVYISFHFPTFPLISFSGTICQLHPKFFLSLTKASKNA